MKDGFSVKVVRAISPVLRNAPQLTCLKSDPCSTESLCQFLEGCVGRVRLGLELFCNYLREQRGDVSHTQKHLYVYVHVQCLYIDIYVDIHTSVDQLAVV